MSSSLSTTFSSNYFPILTSTLSVFSLSVIYWFYTDYKAWLALGAGGLPYNIRGYAYQNYLRMLLSRDTKSTECYANAKSSGEESRNFLSSLPKRVGKPPKVGLWAAPHRQLDMMPSEEIKEVGYLLRLSTSLPSSSPAPTASSCSTLSRKPFFKLSS